MARFVRAVLICLAAVLVRDADAGPATAAPPVSTVNLQLSVGPVHAKGTAFSEIIDGFRVQTGQNIFVNWGALEPHHVARDLPVTVDLSALPLDRALNQLLEHVGGRYVRLGYAVDENVITITTAAEISKNVLTRVYDIRAAIHGAASRAKDVDALLRRVRGIDPLSWKDAGGEIGEIRELGGQLIVTQIPENQRLIVEELRDVLPTRNSALAIPLINN